MKLVTPGNSKELLKQIKHPMSVLVGSKYRHKLDYICESIIEKTDLDLSRYLVDDSNSVVGIVLIGNNNLFTSLSEINSTDGNLEIVDTDLLKKLVGKNGVECVLIWVNQDLRNKGLGGIIKRYIRNLPFDYFWAGAMRNINNLDMWKNKSKHIASSSSVHFVAELLK